VLDAAYWMKGCSSLGLLRFAVLLGIGKGKKRDLALMDVKEAVKAAAPRYAGQKMPKDNAARVVEGALHLSPHLGKRMVAAQVQVRSVFIRELLPQDLKIEIERLTIEDGTKAASFLAGVVGKAHARQMDRPPAKHGLKNWNAIAPKRWMRRTGYGPAWWRWSGSTKSPISNIAGNMPIRPRRNNGRRASLFLIS